MADVQITCRKCGNVATISEFADRDSFACRQCGERLQKPDEPVRRHQLQKTHAPGQKHDPAVGATARAQSAAAEEPTPMEWRFHRHTKKEEITGQSAVFTAHHIGSWIVFLVLGSLAGWLRYGGFLEPAQLATIKQYAPIVLLVLHIAIILTAFKHSVFQGTLSFLIPPYPYYFLFTVSDAFYLRAVTAGAFMGIGQDALFFVSDKSTTICNIVTGWIARGGS